MCVLFYLKKEALGGFPFFPSLVLCHLSSFISYLNNFLNLLGFEELEGTIPKNGILGLKSPRRLISSFAIGTNLVSQKVPTN